MYDPGDPEFQNGRWPLWGLLVFVALMAVMIVFGFFAARAQGDERWNLSAATVGSWGVAMLFFAWMRRRSRAGRA